MSPDTELLCVSEPLPWGTPNSRAFPSIHWRRLREHLLWFSPLSCVTLGDASRWSTCRYCRPFPSPEGDAPERSRTAGHLWTLLIEQQRNPVPRGRILHGSVKDSRVHEQDTGYSGGMTVSLLGASAIRPMCQRHHHAYRVWSH